MFEFFSLSYFVILVFAIVCMFTVVVRRQRTSESHTLSGTMQMIVVFACASMIGYTLRVIAVTPEEYIFGEKFILLGGCFIYYFMLCFYRRLCRIGIPRWFMFILAFISSALSAASFTFTRHSLFFRSLTPYSDGVHYNQAKLEYGPLFYLYVIMIAVYSVSLVAMSAWNLWVSRKKKRKVTAVLLLVAAICCPAAPFVADLLINSKYEIMPFGFLSGLMILMYLLYGENIHDIVDISHEFVFTSVRDGLIILDDEYLFNSCNDHALEIFPELEGIRANTDLRELSERLGKIISGEDTEIEIDGKYYECSLKEVTDGKRLAGAVVWITDITEHKKHLDLMANYQAKLEGEVKVKTADLEQMRDRLVINIANMIENRDNPTGGHVKRTSDVVAILIASMMEDNEFGLSDEFYESVIKTAPMHDLGKMAVDDRILLKPGKFTPEEFEVMKTHTTKGAGFVASVLEDVNDSEVVQIAENVALYHHEKWNGEGYPQHLKGEEIPIEARIMAIADVYDALVSKRCYKEKMSFEQAYNIIIEEMGTHFDPKLEKYFVRCRPALENYYSSVNDN